MSRQWTAGDLRATHPCPHSHDDDDDDDDGCCSRTASGVENVSNRGKGGNRFNRRYRQQPQIPERSLSQATRRVDKLVARGDVTFVTFNVHQIRRCMDDSPYWTRSGHYYSEPSCNQQLPVLMPQSSGRLRAASPGSGEAEVLPRRTGGGRRRHVMKNDARRGLGWVYCMG
jgi:hypothetical protein